MNYIRINDRNIFYHDGGGNAPALVLVHGLTCDMSDWSAQVDGLGDTYRIVRIDLAGHGASREATSGCNVDSYAADLATLLDTLELRNAVLAGHSMGCRPVLQAARLRPAAVRGAILVDGSRTASGTADKARIGMQQQLQAKGFHGLLQRMFDQMFTAQSDPAMRERIIARALEMPESAGTELMTSMAVWDAESLEETLRELECPILLLQSTYLNEKRERASLRAGQSIPYMDVIRSLATDGRAEVVPGAGHFNMIEAADRINIMIREFVGGLP